MSLLQRLAGRSRKPRPRARIIYRLIAGTLSMR